MKKKNRDKLIQQIADEVQHEFDMGGLSCGLYFDYAKEVAIRYANKLIEYDKRRKNKSNN